MIWVLRKCFVIHLSVADLFVWDGYGLYIKVSNKQTILFFVLLNDNIFFYVLQSCNLTTWPTCLFKTSKINCYTYKKLALPELHLRDWKLLDRYFHITNIQR